MNCRFFFNTILLLFLFSLSVEAKPQNKPNIIFFLVDDMGWQDTSLPFWHDKEGKPVKTFLNKRYSTPNMEKLAEQGMKFTNAYAQPVCSPTRVSLMSGMNAARHRVTNWTLNQDTSTDARNSQLTPPDDWNVNGLQPEGTKASGTTTRPITGETFSYSTQKPFASATPLPSILKKLGYTTIHCGKAHFGTKNTPGANPLLFGFDYNIAGTEIGGPADYRGSKQYGQGPFHINGLDENNYYQDDTFLTEALTIEAIKRLDKIRQEPGKKDKPFYLYMAHYAVHVPLDQRAHDKRFAASCNNPEDGYPWNDTEKNYSCLIKGMDKSLGDIMDYLKKNGLEKNTILIFMADNGGLANQGRLNSKLANYPLSAGKGSCKEGGIREPMIVSWPGVTKPGSVTKHPVIVEDFFPSILQMAGAGKVKTTQIVDGVSFVPALKGTQKVNDQQKPLLFHVPNTWIGENDPNYVPASAMILGDWKLIYRHADQNFSLFNIAEDIGEQKNLADEQVQKTKEMATLMTRLLKQRKAQMPSYKKGNKIGVQEGTSVPWPNEAWAKRK